MRRLARRIATAVLACATLFAQAGASPWWDQAAGTSDAPQHQVVALGDSVPSGRACACSPFPEVYAAALRQRSGVPVTVDNEAISGLTTTGLLEQLQQPPLRRALSRADVVLITIGANDFLDHHDDVVGGSCSGSGAADCVTDDLDAMRSRMTRALGEIRTLRHDQPTTVLVTGYWNVFEDGSVAKQASGTSGLQASLALTRTVNAALRSLSSSGGARYVDLFTPFEHDGRDVDSLLASDGNHPDASGHRLIARILLDVGLPRTTGP